MKPTFVVLTDLSPSAYRAAYLAALAAAAVEAELVLLWLETEPVVEPEFGMVPIPAEYLERQQHDTQTALAELARQLPAPATVYSGPGGLHDALQQLVRQRHPLLLVLGLAAEHDLLDRLVHHYALPVLRDTGLPLLLVPEAAAQNPELPRRVTLALDGEYFQLSPEARRVAGLFSSWQPDYTVVHVAEPAGPAGLNMRAVLTTAHSGGLLPEQVAAGTYEVQQAPRAEGIAQAATDTQADLLVLIARPRSFLAELLPCSLAASVTHHSPVPVLLLPAQPIAVPTGAHSLADGTVY